MAKFPVIEVGDLWTADLANQMLPDMILKTAATTRASITTMADDPDLVVAVLANANYFIEMYIRYATTTAAGFKCEWTVPAGVTSANKTILGPGSSAVDANANNISMRSGVHGFTTDSTYGDRNDVTLQLFAMETAIITTGATAGDVALAWAQEASTAVNTAVGAGSFIRSTRIG